MRFLLIPYFIIDEGIKQAMQILLSNDDGYQAAGLTSLHKALMQEKIIRECFVVAPSENRSAASNSLTLENPLRLKQHEHNYYSVNGTPTDCVHLALTGLSQIAPDMVISGINMGANLGDDVLYSGTVAAAMEGRFLGLPAMAVSINHFQPRYLETAVQVVLFLLKNLSHFDVSSDTILNINVPDVAWNQIKVYQATHLGRRHQAEPVTKMKDPRGEVIYWVGAPGKGEEVGKGTDFHAVKNRYVSITPLHIDLTHYNALDNTANWLKKLSEQ